MNFKNILISILITFIESHFLHAEDIKNRIYPTTLTSGIDKFGIAPKNTYVHYKIHLSAGDKLDVKLHHMDADGNLYVKDGSKATSSSFDCKSTNKTKYIADTCSLIAKKDRNIYISVYAFACKNTVEHRIKATITPNLYLKQEKHTPTLVEKNNKHPNICNQSNLLNIPNNNSTKPCSVSTFHNISIYWNAPNIGVVNLEYRTQDGSWKKAQSMLYKPIKSLITYTNKYRTVNRNDVVSKGNYRGSIVNLQPNTAYEIRVNGKNSKIIKASTLNEKFKIKKVRTIFNACQKNYSYQNKDTCVVRSSGSKKDGYIVIDGMKKNGTKTILDLRKKRNNYNFNISNKSYVILRNFKLKGAKVHAVFIKNSHHIVVENCDISEWGTKHRNYARQETSAIFSASNLHSSVFQRNKIFNPKYTSNSWGELNDNHGNNHPMGSQAITLKYCIVGNNIIRYNNIYSTNGNYFNDAIGGEYNWSHYGSPGADSDIYGNYIANAYDDAIESEGGNQNVRIWNNFIEKTYLAIGNAVATIGPLYIWKNVTGKAELVGKGQRYTCTPYQEYNGPFLKMGSVNLYVDDNYKLVGKHFWDKNKLTKKISMELMQGTMYIYNNTILNKGIEGYGGYGTTKICTKNKFDNRNIKNIISRNNILHVPHGVNSISSNKHGFFNNSFDYDMLSEAGSFAEIHGLKRTMPSYKNLHIPNIQESIMKGNFSLKGRGTKVGKCIPNFIHKNREGTVDMGAHDRLDDDMIFGVDSNFTKYLKKSYRECK